MKLKTKFWYESKVYFGWIESLTDLQKACNAQMGEYGRFTKVSDFLDQSRQRMNGTLNFGSRWEHTGELTLREYLKEIDVLNDFLSLM